MIERAIAQGADVLDLLQGGEGYKQFWSKNINFDLNLIVFPKNLYGYFLFLVTIMRSPLQKIYHAFLYLKGCTAKNKNYNQQKDVDVLVSC